MLSELIHFLLENKEDFSVEWTTDKSAVVAVGGERDHGRVENDLLEFVVKGKYNTSIRGDSFLILCVEP